MRSSAEVLDLDAPGISDDIRNASTGSSDDAMETAEMEAEVALWEAMSEPELTRHFLASNLIHSVTFEGGRATLGEMREALATLPRWAAIIADGATIQAQRVEEEAEMEALKAEAARLKAEKKAEMEALRAEAARLKAEIARPRAVAETARLKAEAARLQAENARLEAELQQ